VVVVVVGLLAAVTLIKSSNCLEICQSKFASALCPICLAGIAIINCLFGSYKNIIIYVNLHDC